ncbi:hypothetical protein GJAV_G00246660 [Gymnothorax javanicus]|nr:hypothetical protein GJAV_G00246660 [Gymnothorax javanicus]
MDLEAMTRYTSPVNPAVFPHLTVVLLAIGMFFTAWFFVYEWHPSLWASACCSCSSGSAYTSDGDEVKDETRHPRMGAYDEKKETCGTICLKYLLFSFNFLFWLAGGAVMAVGIWTLVEKSDYISLLSSSTYAASAYILILAGVIVMVTGVLGCCATFKEQRNLLRVYFVLLLCIFLLEILAGVLAYIYYQQLNEELKQNLRETMVQKYQQENENQVTQAVDKLQQEFKCCGSNSSADWIDSKWARSALAGRRVVPDSCCKTPTERCGERDHPSNIYKVEGGCITQLEKFILDHLRIIGAVGIGIACVQIFGMVFTCCLYRNLKSEPY